MFLKYPPKKKKNLFENTPVLPPPKKKSNTLVGIDLGAALLGIVQELQKALQEHFGWRIEEPGRALGGDFFCLFFSKDFLGKREFLFGIKMVLENVLSVL